ncbi:DEHA2C15290p [Debaryomyces hansenii CBS767]|uniref:DEHA2C15290p n=1 Tax=Debaryomyces hansenii (strain ATCC 36239 / CBS 767 / BCRC 21394 / JCM 1990 / NBRC 0083 / IGC 2968) TaxID=284592 RepID=Q6BTW9_DEBHA|nr:DEHA2C15290p [Debaryomyces hansenii CBS767]CAG86430.2 DEHA2C15290p [Debaryomyces hansenii CBS767]|eukprot:XP_458350.2 DEHA2C15290p [Debaryomyces hansenii CBS767]
MTGTQQQSEIIETVSSNDSDLVRDVKQDEKMQTDDVEKLSGDGIEKTKSDVNSDANLSLYKKFKIRVPRHTLYFHILLGSFFTAWWLSILIQDKHRHEWLIPTVLWGLLMLRLISWHCRILYVLFNYCQKVWYFVTDIVYTKILTTRPRRLMVGAVITVGVILLGTFVPTETEYSRREDRAVSFFGIVVAIFGLYLTSNNRNIIQWNTVIGGVLMQFIIALFVLRTKCGYDIFNFISTLARELLGFAKDGVAFLTTTEVSQLGMFFFTVLPSVAFFVAFIHIWYYYGVVQWFIGKFAYLFFWTLRVSGAEAITAAASPFLGIGESAILIKDLVPYLTKAELHQIMCSGFSTISGAVLVGYIGLGLNPQALVSSCVMSIPASLAVSKLRYPETEVPVSNSKFNIPTHSEDEATRPKNVLQAFSNGATLGLRIAGTMMIQCMCIIGLVALCNGLLTWFGNYWNIHELTLELMLSYILYPIGFLLGTPRNEILHVTKLIGTKVIQNEFVAYNLLITESPYKEMSKRGTLIATYALCGFSNLGSLGITLGVLNTLTNNSRSRDITSSIISALFTGGIATLTSAAIAAMVIHDLGSFDIN